MHELLFGEVLLNMGLFSFIYHMKIITSFILLLILSVSIAGQSRKPNIVLIVADDLGYADLGSYGQKKIRTPNLDRMAAEGMRFTQFYSGSPVCAPSRSTLMSGKHSGHADIRDNKGWKPEGQWPINDKTVTIAELLKSQGYVTGAFGKWGLGYIGTEGDPNRQGFDLFYGYNCQSEAHNYYPDHLWRNDKRIELEGNNRGVTGKQYSHDLIEAESLKFIRENKEKPFFLFAPFTIPHLALQVPEDSLMEYQGKFEETPYTGKAYQPHPTPRAAYAAMVTRMDRSIGRMLDLLKELNLDDNTIVIFTSDNGPTFNTGGADSAFFQSAWNFRGLKGSVYEGGMRVPLIARWPGKIKGGGVSDYVSANYDILPTLADIVGAKPSKDIDGISLFPAMTGRRNKKHEFLYWEFAGYGGQQAIRLGDWKAVRTQMNKGNTKIELYNLSSDVSEKSDVADKHPDVIKRIEKIMREEHQPSKVFPNKVLDGI